MGRQSSPGTAPSRMIDNRGEMKAREPRIQAEPPWVSLFCTARHSGRGDRLELRNSWAMTCDDAGGVKHVGPQVNFLFYPQQAARFGSSLARGDALQCPDPPLTQ